MGYASCSRSRQNLTADRPSGLVGHTFFEVGFARPPRRIDGGSYNHGTCTQKTLAQGETFAAKDFRQHHKSRVCGNRVYSPPVLRLGQVASLNPPKRRHEASPSFVTHHERPGICQRMVRRPIIRIGSVERFFKNWVGYDMRGKQ